MTILTTLESYYDMAPRASATTEQVGPFTLKPQRSGFTMRRAPAS